MASRKKTVKKLTYAEALAELEEIVSGIEAESTDLDHLTGQVKRARELIAFCKGRLRSTEEGVKKVLSDMETEPVEEPEEAAEAEEKEKGTEKEKEKDEEQDLF
jgi:exodeoxyribonuclease VII small subunit